MTKLWRSRSGWFLAGIYMVAAIILFHEAMTCTSMFCDLVAMPVFLPAGWIYWLPFSGALNYVADPMRRWEFVIPVTATNAVIYYFLGFAIASGIRKLSKTSVL